tara:strand:- start:1642 stop:2118 length:477 start_codon:yes stop_codon:yes gene_type:complete
MKNKNLNDWAISDELFSWVRENLDEGKTILEFGSGTGTIELTKHWNTYSVEQDQKWVGKAPNSNYIYAPIKDGWYDKEIVFSLIPKSYDLMIIDGPGGSDLRPGVDKYLDKLNTDIPIILDDTHRKKDRDHAINIAKILGKEWEEIKGWQKNFIVIKP